ncbi:MAG: sulfur carrier protein ThiS [Planctomycetaceae bacterium]
MQITINGEEKNVLDELTVSGLLEQLEIRSKFCAVERNKELVPRGQHANCILQPGDRLEIVTLVGGG